MSFQDRFHKQQETFRIESVVEKEVLKENAGVDAQQHLRNLGYKIKLETRTRFGVQIDLAKHYPEDVIRKDLKGFNFELDGECILIKP